MIYKCKVCNKEFKSYRKNRANKYCDKDCMMYARKHLGEAPMQGKKHSTKTKNKMAKSARQRIIDKPYTIPDWTDRLHSKETRLKYLEDRGGNIDRTKGNYRIGYVNIHKYIRKRYDIKNICESCGVNCKTQLSNKTGKYLKDISDWQELCPKCHRQYDIKYKLDNTYKADICV